jgi:RimJ/RimL family protein N-acetyltransferase
MMDPLDYLHLQLRLEGKEVVDQVYLRQVEAVPDEDVPLVLIARFVDGAQVTYYDEVTSAVLRNEWVAQTADLEFPNIGPLLDALKRQNIYFEVGYYKTYVVPSMPAEELDVQCFSKSDPRVKAFEFDVFAEYVYAVERDGRIVSTCVSARENEKCGEAWVYTDPGYRNQGHAQRAVKAWGRSLLKAGKVPFYSHKIENLASANLARRLELQPVFEEIAITQK